MKRIGWLQTLATLREATDLCAPSHPQFAAPSSSTPNPALAQLHSRTWLLHWSLFVYFNHPQGRILLLKTCATLLP